MKFQSKIAFFACLFLLSPSLLLSHDSKKIVALMEVRNEENIIEQHLRALAYYTDAIVIVDDASDDLTPFILETFADEFNIKKIITNKISSRDCGNESDNYQLLLDAGRAIGGTHFIVIDADEMFSANCLDDNYLRNQILALQPGEQMVLSLISLWKSTQHYDSSRTGLKKRNIFCDKPGLYYPTVFLNSAAVPEGLLPPKYLDFKHPLLHFQFVNWRFLLVKQAWYRCLEHIKNPSKPIKEINDLYGCTTNDSNVILKDCPSYWLDGYEFFDPSIYQLDNNWREKQVLEWFSKYGKNHFKNLDIWNIDWGKGLKR